MDERIQVVVVHVSGLSSLLQRFIEYLLQGLVMMHNAALLEDEMMVRLLL